ncbi:unnamed protein product [Angiostrongylus costaricensis]|uniref:SAC domain-containing protein n=1 Tax=Angiostrongylus costaricensis TaxID=334426 RepID=A0A158PFT1_ANGCS|nr:unnamed protein product [Angiostrongylus costaricensis]
MKTEQRQMVGHFDEVHGTCCYYAPGGRLLKGVAELEKFEKATTPCDGAIAESREGFKSWLFGAELEASVDALRERPTLQPLGGFRARNGVQDGNGNYSKTSESYFLRKEGIIHWTICSIKNIFLDLLEVSTDESRRLFVIQGLYFSYYKTIINAESYYTGLQQITNDNLTEYGHTINTLKRFNLYPEVLLSFAYRQFKRITNTLGWKLERCWTINRGDLAPVESCEGIGNSHYFYIRHVFALAGTTAGWLFLLGLLVR